MFWSFWLKPGKTPRVPAPIFHLLQIITFGESHQIASALLLAAQWTLPGRSERPPPKPEQFHIPVLSGEDAISTLPTLDFRLPRNEISLEGSTARPCLEIGPVFSSAF